MKQKSCLIFILFLAFSVAIPLLSPLPAAAAETGAPLITSCECDVYVVETDPAGVDVRSGPNNDSPVVATLPRLTRVRITGSVGEWMHVSPLKRDDQLGWVPQDPSGWVSGPLLGVRTRYFDFAQPNSAWYDPSGRAKLYSRPINGSTIVTRVPDDTEVTIVGCWRGWLKVRYKGVEGWLPSYCGDPDGWCP